MRLPVRIILTVLWLLLEIVGVYRTGWAAMHSFSLYHTAEEVEQIAEARSVFLVGTILIVAAFGVAMLLRPAWWHAALLLVPALVLPLYDITGNWFVAYVSVPISLVPAALGGTGVVMHTFGVGDRGLAGPQRP